MHCGRTKEQHCPGFEVRQLPEGCKCDEGSWGDNVTPICEKFIPMGKGDDASYCLKCEHDKACHRRESHSERQETK